MPLLPGHLLITAEVAALAVTAALMVAPGIAEDGNAAAPGRSHLPPGQCFRTRDIKSWIAPNAHTLNLKVMANRYYRVDLARDCPPLAWKDAQLITGTYGSGTICAPLDWSLSASDWQSGTPQTCFIQNITLLTQEQADALPKSEKPP